MKLWRNYVKVYQVLDEPAAYSIQWLVWCWRKPIYIGLPLIWLAVPIMGLDTLLAVVYIFVNWGGEPE
ncbi:hypothetical protein ES703_104306 [subsurface metagenome]